MELVLPADNDGIVRGARAIEALCDEAGFAPRRTAEVRTAVLEALSNALVHGSGRRPEAPIRLRAEIHGAGLVVEVSDGGRGPEALPPRPNLARKLEGEESPYGWGIHVMSALASEVEFRVQPGRGHTVRLRFDARPPAAPVRPEIRRPGDA